MAAASEYTFKMDYYWMMGDNRHSSLDSGSGIRPGRPLSVNQNLSGFRSTKKVLAKSVERCKSV
jgi:hypothetical protein